MVETNNSKQDCEVANYLLECKNITKNPDIFKLSEIVNNTLITKDNLYYHMKYIILILIRKRHFVITEEINNNVENININEYKAILNNLKKCDYICDKTLFIYYIFQEEYEFFVTISNIVESIQKYDKNKDKEIKDIYGEYFSTK